MKAKATVPLRECHNPGARSSEWVVIRFESDKSDLFEQTKPH